MPVMLRKYVSFAASMSLWKGHLEDDLQSACGVRAMPATRLPEDQRERE